MQQQHVDAQFSNGYRLGQVLEAYGLCTDLDRFINKDSPDAKLANFQRLQPVFRSLNIKFDSHTANQLMTEEPGIAMALLQQMKVKLDVPAPVGSRAPTGRSRGSTALLLTTNRMASKAKYKEMEEDTYNSTLRLKTADPREFRMANHLRAFEEEAIRQQREAEVMDALEMMTKQQRLADGREGLRTKLAENRAYLQDWEREGRINHAKNQAIAKERERRDLKLELALREKTRRTAVFESQAAADEVSKGIDGFEDSLRRMQDTVDEEIDEALLTKTTTETPHEFLESLQARVARGADMAKESEAYINKVKERRMQDILARKERDRRRRRVLVEQMRTQKDMEASKAEAAIREKLVRQSAEEERIAERMHESLAMKEVMRRQRQAREEQYRAQREAQLQAVRGRDVLVYAEQRKEYMAKLDRERSRFEELERQRQAARAQKYYQSCRGIVDQLVDLTAKTCEYRAVTQGNLVPSKQWREWLVTFHAGLPLYPEDAAASEAALAQELPAEDEKIAALLDAREYLAYLDQEEEWAPPPPPAKPAVEGEDETAPAGEGEAGEAGEAGAQARSTGNAVLGAALKQIRRRLALPVPEPVAPDDVASAKKEILLAVTGAPLAGVSRQASRLAGALELTVVRVHALVGEAVQAYEATMQAYEEALSAAKEAAGEDGEPEEVEAPDFSDKPMQVLGGRAREALSSGQAVPDGLLVDVIIEHLKTVDGKGAVLDGFPATVEQARVLEARLAGVLDVHVEPQEQPEASRLAPPPAEDESGAPPLPSALTLHVRLHVDKELSLRRRLGRMMDPEAPPGAPTFHLEFDPPPEDDSALCARLIEAPDPDNSDLLTRIASYTDERAVLGAWLDRFAGTSQELDASEGLDDVFARVQEAVDARLLLLNPPPAPEEEAPEDAPAEPPAAAPAAAAEGEGGEEAEAAAAEPPAEEDAVGEPPAAEFVPVEVHADVANMLLQQWTGLESEFEREVKRLLRAVRDEHRLAINWVAQTRDGYMEMLTRPHAEKLKLVHAFQAMFNAVDLELRGAEETKNELHERVNDLQQSLWEISDVEREAAEEERSAVMEDSRLSDGAQLLVSYAVEMLQQEVLRFQATQSGASLFFP